LAPIVNDFFIDACPMHKMRRLALVEYINSIINGNSLTVTIMGRGIESNAFEKHSIKRSNRLCSNDHLHKERTKIYGGICKLWIPASAWLGTFRLTPSTSAKLFRFSIWGLG
jgi:hypothetical protein